MRVRALLTDLDGVLRRWAADNNVGAERLGELPSGAIARVAFAPDCLSPAIRGEITDEAWRRDIASRLAALVPPEAARAVVEAWSISAGEVVQDVHDLLQACRSECRLILVTNATDRLPRDLRALGLSAAFDGVINSSAIGCEKPREEIFTAALELAGVEPGEALFVDDSATHVAAAKRLGLRGHHFTGASALSSWLLEQDLRLEGSLGDL